MITDNTILDFVGTERKCETSIHVHTLLQKHHILDLVATESMKQAVTCTLCYKNTTEFPQTVEQNYDMYHII